MKKALITGITGQDGSYLAELLLNKNYEVHGVVRRVGIGNKQQRFWRINHILDKINLHSATIETFPSIYNVIKKIKPDELYHLAAQSFVKDSFDDEFTTMNVNINGTHYILASVKEIVPQCKVLFAASSEMFGKVKEIPQNEKTPFCPRSIYGISKVAGYNLIKHYRDAHNLFACSSICFNHESPRRGDEFVTRKISKAVARILLGLDKELRVGNIKVKRDWGFAGDYVKGMWLMLQQDKPDDFVFATGETHSVEEFIKEAFNTVDIDNWQEYVKIDKRFFRKTEVDILLGDASKARQILNWQPSVKFKELVEMMVAHDVEIYRHG